MDSGGLIAKLEGPSGWIWRYDKKGNNRGPPYCGSSGNQLICFCHAWLG